MNFTSAGRRLLAQVVQEARGRGVVIGREEPEGVVSFNSVDTGTLYSGVSLPEFIWITVSSQVANAPGWITG